MFRNAFRSLLRTQLQRREKMELQASPWSFGNLEDRFLLAADAGVAVAEAGIESPTAYIAERVPAGVSPASHTTSSTTATSDSNVTQSLESVDISARSHALKNEIVFIDSRVENHSQMIQDIGSNAEIVIVDSTVSGIEFVSSVLSNRSDVTAIHLIGHGVAGHMELGRDGLNQRSVQNNAQLLSQWKDSIVNEGDILIYGCETGAESSGAALVSELAYLTGLDVAASTDKTGADALGANWNFEIQVGSIETNLAFSAALQQSYANVLPITIRAAGQTGDERMELQIDGATVQVWENIGGNYANGVFQTFTYNANGISADRIRVAFTNDEYRDGGYDRNLRVESITTDGVTIRSDAAQVFSSGSWNSNTEAIGSGYLQTDSLVTNGYFQYSDASNSTTQISIRAAGQTGDEQMQLLIDNEVVATWDGVAGDRFNNDYQTFTYTANKRISVEQIRVAFSNDYYNSETGEDRNLYVDTLSVNGVSYRADSPTVFSTGTWDPTVGYVRSGFYGRNELASNGYFEFSSDQTNNGEAILIHASGSEGGEQMNLRIHGEIVRSWIVEAGANQGVFHTYGYRAEGNVSADDIQIEFVGDRYLPGVIDANLRVDALQIGSRVYQTESASTLTITKWSATDFTGEFSQSEFLYTDSFFQFTEGGNAGGTVGLASSRYTVSEDAGQVILHVVRNGGTNGSLVLDYATVAGTATPGQDYVSKSGSIVFLPGQSTVAITVDLLNDSLFEGNETFNLTIDNLQGTGMLGAPRTATILIEDTDTVLPNYANFNSSTGLKLNGSASLQDNTLRLTPTTNNTIGGAFFTTPLPVTSTTSFQTNFGFRIDGGNGVNGADGFAFVIQNSAAGSSALGTGTGGALGYNGITNSVVVEFDTYQNPGEVSNNHVSIVVNGSSIPLVTRNVAFDLNNGGNHRAWIDYNGDSKTLAVYVSNNNTKPTTPLATATIDLAAIVGDKAYLGFTAATGGANNNHRILNWTTSLTPPTITAPNPGINLANEVVASGFAQPTDMEFSPDGSNIYVSQQDGKVFVVRNGQKLTTPFIDISSQVNGTRDRGLLDIALHPDFENNPYVYLLFTYDPPEVYQNANHALAGPDKNGNRAGRLIRVTADAATNYTTAVAGSEVVLLGKNSTWENFNAFANSTSNFNEPAAGIRNGVNVQDFIASDSESHTIGSLAFGLDGSLFVAIGDGTSYNRVDPRTVRVQDIDNLSGKVLRIDPLTGAGLSDNPFYNGNPDANRSKVYQLGLRNPFRITVDSATGKLYIGDVGWTQWEEINSAGAGANFGWPYYEGGNGNSIRTSGYQDLPEARAFYASGQQVVAPLVGRSHSATGINAIVLGSVYRGDTYPPQYQGNIFFNDLGQGIVSSVSFNADGTVAGVQQFATGAKYVTQIIQGIDGNLYYVDLDDGRIGRWVFV